MRATALTEQGERFVIVHHENITQRRQAEILVRRQAHLLNEVDAAVICSDLGGVVSVWHGAAERLYGWSEPDAVGQLMSDLASGPVDEEMIREMVVTLQECGSWEGEKEVENRDGRQFWCYMRNSLMYDDEGAPAGVIGISVDITERNQHLENLDASRDYLRAITASITDGLLALNSDCTVVYGNTAAADLLGWSPADLIGQPVGTVVGCDHDELCQTIFGEEIVRREDEIFTRADGASFPVGLDLFTAQGRPAGGGARTRLSRPDGRDTGPGATAAGDGATSMGRARERCAGP